MRLWSGVVGLTTLPVMMQKHQDQEAHHNNKALRLVMRRHCIAMLVRAWVTSRNHWMLMQLTAQAHSM